MIRTLLIANRGEIACRIARTARRLGVTPVAIHSDADAGAFHLREIDRSIRVGPGPATGSYLNAGAILAAARRAEAEAVHPGYGFLSENPDFAQAVEAEGMLFLGPTPATLARFGDKASAKAAARAAGLSVVPGLERALSDPAEIAAEARRMGLPVLLKAVGGGGGRGQRIVTDAASLADDIEAALREARSAFGSEGLLIERFLPAARHVEVQIVGDGAGTVLHLHERDCTLQRRRQKVIEEAPATDLSPELVARLTADAVRLGESVAYRSLGTVEFLVAGDEHFFLEVNPRLQVEHPVTEAITGLDLVELQLRIAAGEGLGLGQDDIRRQGHAIEARLYAEDPASGFAPSTGRIRVLSLPRDIRVDSGVEAGDMVTPFYDPMIAKLIVHAPDRPAALNALSRALAQSAVAGVATNRDFLVALAGHADVAAMAVHTGWIDANLPALTEGRSGTDDRLWRAIAAALHLSAGRMETGADPWQRRDLFTGWRLGLGVPQAGDGQRIKLAPAGRPDEAAEFHLAPMGAGGAWTATDAAGALAFTLCEAAPGRWRLTHEGESVIFPAGAEGDLVEISAPAGRHLWQILPQLAPAAAGIAHEGTLASPLTGSIVRVFAATGETVAAGDTIAVLESMKMEIPIRAPVAGRLDSIAVAEGDMVERGQRIAEILAGEIS